MKSFLLTSFILHNAFLIWRKASFLCTAHIHPSTHTSREWDCLEGKKNKYNFWARKTFTQDEVSKNRRKRKKLHFLLHTHDHRKFIFFDFIFSAALNNLFFLLLNERKIFFFPSLTSSAKLLLVEYPIMTNFQK